MNDESNISREDSPTMSKMLAERAASAEVIAVEALSAVRDFVEVLRIEFRPRTTRGQQQQQQRMLEDTPLYTRMKARNLPGKLQSIRHNANNADDERESDGNVSSSFQEQRRSVLTEVALPLAEILSETYQVLDDLPEASTKPDAQSESAKSQRRRRTKNRPAPPRGMLSIQDYTDVACLLEFIVCTGILPFQQPQPQQQQQQQQQHTKKKESPSSSHNNSSLVEERLRTKLPKSLAGRIPKDALRWGTSSTSSEPTIASNNDSKSLSLLVRTTETITRVVVLDRFRPMLLPRHLVDIYGACFRIEYLSTTANGNETIEMVGENHYRVLGLSLPLRSMGTSHDESSGMANASVVVDPTLRAMAYQTLLTPTGGHNQQRHNQRQQHDRYHLWLQKRVSTLLTELATGKLRGLSAILTVFVPVLSSSTDQVSLMSGASQRLGRTLAAMTASEAEKERATNLQGRLCQQFLQLLVVASPVGQEMAGIPPRSMAVIQTAWAFFEHLPRPVIESFILRPWATNLLGTNGTGGIHETIRQVGALCAFVPPHSRSAPAFLLRAALATTDSHGDSTLLGQLLRVATTRMKTTALAPSAASRDAEQTLLLLTQAIYVGNSTGSASARGTQEKAGMDKIVAAWISALGPTQWDLARYSYKCKNVPSKGKSPMETIIVEQRQSLLTPTPMEEFAASVESTTERAEFFVDKILSVLAPPSTSDRPRASDEEDSPSSLSLQVLPSRLFRNLLKEYLAKGDNGNGNARLVSTVMLPMLCEKCSQEQLLFGDYRDNASGLLLLIRQILSELVDARTSKGEKDDDDVHRHEFLKSIAGILTSLLIALMEVGSKSRSKEEEEILQSFLPTFRELSASTAAYHSNSQVDRKDGAAMADMAAYAMALIASRKSIATEDNTPATKTNLCPEDQLQNILDEAERDLGSTQAPIRAKGMVSLGRLARGFTGALGKEQKAPSLVQELNESRTELGRVDNRMTKWIERVLELSMVALGDNESYVYLAAIQTIVAVGDLHPRKVLPMVASTMIQGEFLGFDTTNAHNPTAAIELSQEQIIKLAEALMFIIRRRAVTDEYVELLMNFMLRGGTPNTAKDDECNVPEQKDHKLIQRETDHYFATGKFRNEEPAQEDTDDENALTKKEFWEEQDIRLRTGGPIFQSEEAEVVRSLRITVLSELVALSEARAVVSNVRLLARMAIEALHLEGGSRIVQRSAALLARELYSRILREATELSESLVGIEDLSSRPVLLPFSVALVESDEAALSATLRTFAFGTNISTNAEIVTDSTVVARCKEALSLREKAEEAGVFLAAKLVLEERHQLEELPALFRGLGYTSEGGSGESKAVRLNPIETLR